MSDWRSKIPGLGFGALEETQEQLARAKADVRSLREKLEGQTHLLDYQRNFLPAKRMKAVLTSQVDQYRSASPFPHIVLDDFVDPRILERVVQEIDAMDRTEWHRTNNPNERKVSTEDEAVFGIFVSKLILALNSGRFVTFLEQLTGIEGLIADPHLRGGGIHEIEPGGKLGVHADFNFYPRLKLYRRLNLLLYLNKEWQSEWGGTLELWDAERRPVKRIEPFFNRAVIFDTSNASLHGHPEPLACPPGRTRKSIALYYYSVDYPYDQDLQPHSTLFADTDHDH